MKREKNVSSLLFMDLQNYNFYNTLTLTDKIENTVIVAKPQPQEYLIQDEINDELLFKALNVYGVDEPGIVLAQAKLESGDYKSQLTREKNNLFGLYDSKKQDYMTFGHWSDCVYIYKILIQSKMKKKEDYYHFLNRIGYAEDEEYILKLQAIYGKLDKKFKVNDNLKEEK